MIEFIKYFDGNRKNMSFLGEDEEIILKYNKIGKKIFKSYDFKLDSQPVYDKIYMKTKSKTYGEKANTAFSDNEIPKEKTHYSCIPAICIDSVLNLHEKNYLQVYLEQCKYRQKKKKLINFIDAELEKSSHDVHRFQQTKYVIRSYSR